MNLNEILLEKYVHMYLIYIGIKTHRLTPKIQNIIKYESLNMLRFE